MSEDRLTMTWNRLSEINGLLERAIGKRADYIIPPWWEWNFWEPSVQLALKDLCRPGDVAFDIGANAAALTVLMSRLVGLKGRVYGFEAAARIIDKTQFNVVQAGCTNVQLFHCAVYHETGKYLPLFEGDHFNDSLYSMGLGRQAAGSVPTVALDDFVGHWGDPPSLIKADVEGAEFDVLQGGRRLLADHKPHLILEQSPGDLRCVEMLLGLGYVCIDLATYLEVRDQSDFTPGASVANIVAVHRDRVASTPFTLPLKRTLVAELRADQLENIELDPGRYVIEARMEAEASDNALYAGVADERGPICRYHTNAKFMADAYRFFPIEIDRRQTVRFFTEFTGAPDPAFKLRGAYIHRIDGVAVRPFTLA